MKKVLIVDDDKYIREFIVDMIEDEFLTTCLHVDSVKRARQILQETKVDLVISDYMMPEESGLSFFEYIRKNKLADFFILFTGTPNIQVPNYDKKVFHLVREKDLVSLFRFLSEGQFFD